MPGITTAAAGSGTGKIRFEGGGGGAFFKEAKRAVEARLTAEGRSRFADGRILVKALIFGGGALAAYSGILFSGLPSPALFGFAVIYQLAALFLAINLGHDAVHDALTPNPRVNRLIYLATFTLLGVDGRLWFLRHRKSHHVFPNVLGCDADIDDNPFVRLSPHHPWRPHHRFQHFYAPFLYTLVAVHSIAVQDFVYLRKKRLANLRNLQHTPGQLCGFFLRKAIYFMLCLGLPISLLVLPAWQIVLGWLGATAIMSLTFVALLIGTHFAEETTFPQVDEEGRLPRGWAEHALATSVDWSPESRLVHFFTGGFNAHVTHHLFPNYCHLHYREIDPLVKAAAQRHGLQVASTNLCGLVVSHWRFLKRLSQKGDGSVRQSAGTATGKIQQFVLREQAKVLRGTREIRRPDGPLPADGVKGPGAPGTGHSRQRAGSG
jgi:linoleoyl-CoA desaturase